MSSLSALLTEIDAFLARHAMAESRFGRDAVNDPHLLRRLRGGGDVTLTTVDRLRAFMRGVDGPAPAAQQEAA